MRVYTLQVKVKAPGEWVPFNVPAKVAGWAYDIKCGKLFNCTN